MICGKCPWALLPNPYIHAYCRPHKKWVYKKARKCVGRRAFEALRKKIREDK
jgi:hypothetical protein